MKNIRREDWAIALIKLELEMVGKTMEDAKKNEQWFHEFTFSPEQYEDFKERAMDILTKTYKISQKTAKSRLAMFDLMYGLRVYEDKTTSD